MKMQKRQFRIGELAKTLQVEQFVIRFWEKEFEVTSHRSDGGQRFYNEKDLLKFKTIKQLLYEEGFTIAGAKKQLHTVPATKLLAKSKSTKESFMPASQNSSFSELTSDSNQLLERTKSKLKAIRKKLVDLHESLSQ